MTRTEVRILQGQLNWFARTFLSGVAPIRVDGDMGPKTRDRIRDTKYFLGYRGKNIDAQVGECFERRLRHPRKVDAACGATGRAVARGTRRRVIQRQNWWGSRQWGGSRYFTNKAIRIVGKRAGVSSRKRWETFGNPGSDHHMSQKEADAVDFRIANAQALMDEIAHKLGGPSDVVDFQHFFVKRRGRTYRIQIIAAKHGTGPHLHVGVRRV